MSKLITVIAPIKLAKGKTEADLLAASDRFQTEFVSEQPSVIRRELVRKRGGDYLDIIQFRSMEDLEDVMEKEKESAVCHALFAILEMDQETTDPADGIEICESLETYG